jgi:hypothetical protein
VEYPGVFPFEDYSAPFSHDIIYLFSELVEVGHGSKDSGRQLFAGTDAKPAIIFPPTITAQWEEQVQYLN